jgi:RNA polymerase sigma-70 factor (ECF subfamily)
MAFSSEQEFKQFYINTFPIIRTYLIAKCGNAELAEDLTQEAFVRLWNNQHKVEIEKAKSFLFTVGNNLFLDHLRHHKVKNNYKNSFSIQQDNNDPQFLIEMDEFKQKLEYTIQSMPQGAREVFLLNRIEKLTYAQIADNLGLSVKAIEKRMQKALEVFATLRKRS